MKKLSTLFAIVALTVGLGVAGCKKDEGSKEQPAAKPTEEPVKAADEAKPTEAKPDEAKPAEPAAAAAGDLPAECAEYKAAIEKLATCDKLPQATRDALKQSYEQTSAAWASVPAEGRAALGTACKSAADAVKQSATGC